MKCDKCGFVSFDHLAECRRCGADLEATRERLGFSPLKSELPFLLGSLLKGAESRNMLKGRVAGEPGEPGEPGSMTIFGLEGDRSFDAEPSPADLTLLPEAEVEKGRPAQEELIIELSEADLESLEGGQETHRTRSPGKDR